MPREKFHQYRNLRTNGNNVVASVYSIINDYIQQADSDFPVIKKHASNTGTANNQVEQQTILLTGATGSLGAFMLRDMIRSSRVKKIYCLVRHNNHNDLDGMKQRLATSFRGRLLSESLINSPKIQVLPMSLNEEPYLGWDQDTYHQVKNEVTIIQHCAWSMNVRESVEHYERDMIRGLYNLVKLAYHETNPTHLHFISSNSATAAWGAPSIPEIPVPHDPTIAMPMGYAYSKYIVERLFDYLAKNKNFPCFVERVGQVLGDTENGVWNPNQPYPLMMLGGSLIHMIPDLMTMHVQWLPVDFASASILDIMLKTINTKRSTSISASNSPSDIDNSNVFHILNPKSVSWNTILEVLRNYGIQFEVVSPQRFVEELDKHPENPAYRVKSFFEARYKAVDSDGKSMPVWETKKTVQVAPVLAKAPSFNTDLLKKYIEYWHTIGFAIPIV
ncbi:male sterility protein-domain-containing protein [Phascolomyces articulosus]|uniref:Male sterility protein-domain-containing protein n=1 Tax=Phascolomyces articulosus TaxID=60185 RepID=A0AAD5JV94_9FUNG|nr:male sterility protein-domain-containing protein [Phascolomyces articulosus]